MTILDIALIAARYDTLIARRTTEACVLAAAQQGPRALARMQRMFQRKAGVSAWS